MGATLVACGLITCMRLYDCSGRGNQVGSTSKGGFRHEALLHGAVHFGSLRGSVGIWRLVDSLPNMHYDLLMVYGMIILWKLPGSCESAV